MLSCIFSQLGLHSAIDSHFSFLLHTGIQTYRRVVFFFLGGPLLPPLPPLPPPRSFPSPGSLPASLIDLSFHPGPRSSSPLVSPSHPPSQSPGRFPNKSFLAHPLKISLLLTFLVVRIRTFERSKLIDAHNVAVQRTLREFLSLPAGGVSARLSVPFC